MRSIRKLLGFNKQISISKPKSVAFFPKLEQMSANAYWPILASELEKSGITFCDGTLLAFSASWLFKNRGQVDVLNLHFIQQFYQTRKGYTRFLKVLRFAFYMLLARALGFRTVFTLHNLEPTYQLQPAWLDYFGHWIAANLSERVIVYCQEARQLLVKKYGRRKNIFFVDHPNVIKYYPNTISKKAARNKLNLEDSSIVYTFIGGVRPNKGIEVLIQAFSMLREDDIRLVIAGKIFPPESYAHSLQDMAKRDERISFHYQYIPDDEMQIFINAADIVVLPFSRILTSGTAHLAMSFGRPIIVPQMGCLPELVEPDLGWLFEPENSESLAEAMRMAASGDYYRTGQRAMDKVKAWSTERFAKQTIQAYWEEINGS